MEKLKRFWNLVPALILWAMLSVFLWGWIFTFLTDTAPENKLTLFVDTAVSDATGLAVRLEENALSDEIRMVKVHPFSYAMLDGEPLRRADLYIVREGNLGEYADWFAPLPEGFAAVGQVWEQEGVPVGIKVYDHATGQGAASAYITYEDPQYPNEDYYLLFGKSSPHLEDGLSLPMAAELLNIQ